MQGPLSLCIGGPAWPPKLMHRGADRPAPNFSLAQAEPPDYFFIFYFIKNKKFAFLKIGPLRTGKGKTFLYNKKGNTKSALRFHVFNIYINIYKINI